MVCFCVFYSVKCLIAKTIYINPFDCTFGVILLRLLVYSLLYATVLGNCTETFGIHRSAVVATSSDHRLPCGTSQWTALYSCSELLLFKWTVKSFSPHECACVYCHQFGQKIFLTPNSVAELLPTFGCLLTSGWPPPPPLPTTVGLSPGEGCAAHLAVQDPPRYWVFCL